MSSNVKRLLVMVFVVLAVLLVVVAAKAQDGPRPCPGCMTPEPEPPMIPEPTPTSINGPGPCNSWTPQFCHWEQLYLPMVAQPHANGAEYPTNGPLAPATPTPKPPIWGDPYPGG